MANIQKDTGMKLSKLKWCIAILLLAAGFLANYWYPQIPGPIRVAGWVILFCIVALILVRTTAGHGFWTFAKGARDEVRRVVWPTRHETMQTTLIVFAMVVILALILWGIDAILLVGISWLTGHGG